MATPEEQFEKTCKGEFEEIKGLITKMHNKMFVGNGQPPMSVQIDRLNGFKKVTCWFIAVLSVSWIGIVSKLIYEALRTH
jgi:hypothetical protein